MSKIKKILISLVAFIIATFSRIGGLISKATGILESDRPILLYGPPEPKTAGLVARINKPAILIIAFLIGLLVILSKKLTKKVKAIIIFILVLLVILGYKFMDYIFMNYIEKLF